MEQSSATASPTLEGPHGVTLERYAAISARLADGWDPPDAVLGGEGLTLDDWAEIRGFFDAVFAKEALELGEPFFAERFAELLVEAQDRLAPVPEITPETWASLVLAASAGKLDDVLAEQRLSRADYARLSRHWAARLGREPALAKRYAEAFYGAAKAAP